jgi:hypothetical protein
MTVVRGRLSQNAPDSSTLAPCYVADDELQLKEGSGVGKAAKSRKRGAKDGGVSPHF